MTLRPASPSDNGVVAGKPPPAGSLDDCIPGHGPADGADLPVHVDRRVLATLAALTLVYMWRFVDRGWIPHDDGMLAQIGERVAAGELPHRDFDDPYTGLLGYLHAIGIAAFGPSLRSLRLVLLAFTAAWVPAVYALARRFAAPPGAALVTALALTWSVPNYFAGVPSHYNVFFATFGMLAMVCHLEGGRRTWLVVAGGCGGVSFLVKSAGGLYFVAAALLFLSYRERVLSQVGPRVAAGGEAAAPAARVNPMLVAKGVGTALLAGGLASVSPRLGSMELLHFVLPGTLVALVAWHDEWRGTAAPLRPRLATLWSLIWPFLAGFAAPLLLFLVPYFLSGALDDFVSGVFVAPARRFERASFGLPPPASLWPALPYGLALLDGALRTGISVSRAVTTVVAALLLALVAAAGIAPVYSLLWNSARHLGIFAAAAGCVLLMRHREGDTAVRQRVFLASAMAAFMPLLQIPFAAPIYFAYSAPFLPLAAAAVVRAAGARAMHGAIGAGYLLFAVLWMNPSYIWALGSGYVGYAFVDAPHLRRADIRMLEPERDEYTRLMQIVGRVHPGRHMLALPDCPEVYFLSGRRNPTRHVYEFLARDAVTPDAVIAILDGRDVRVIVINRDPHFSPKLDARFLAYLEARYPYSAEAGRFLVRWGV